MKPNSRNRIICPDCDKPKMFFETENKARNFIKFNGEDILKDNQTIDDLRVYYCPSCCGYHISSKPYRPSYDHRTDNLINAFQKQVNSNKSFLTQLKISNEEIINEIINLAHNANIVSQKAFKQLLNEYFAQHIEISQKQENNIRQKLWFEIKVKRRYYNSYPIAFQMVYSSYIK